MSKKKTSPGKKSAKKTKPAKASSPGLPVKAPHFAEVQPSGADPINFKIKHPSDQALYNLVHQKQLQPIPEPRDPKNLVLTLAQVLGDNGLSREKQLAQAGQIAFHAGGDTGPINGPKTVEEVADKMTNDFEGEASPADVPSFFFHLGDVVYSFGEAKYYYDQFYEPFRNYPAPILAIPGNHDGVVYQSDPAPTLDAFLRNFVNEPFVITPEAGNLRRTAMIQPAVYFAFDAPFVTLIGLYSNVLEDPGVISSEGQSSSPVDDRQIAFLTDQLKRAASRKCAILVATHHPPYTWGSNHSGSPKMLADLDQACKAAKVWPHAFLSGHAHNYQRYTRTVGNLEIPYIVCGNSGHGISHLAGKNLPPLRSGIQVTDTLAFENYDDKNFGYLRIICDISNLRIEYHDATPGHKSYSDAVTVDLKTGVIVPN